MGNEYTNGPILIRQAGGGGTDFAIATESMSGAGNVAASDNGSGSLYAEGMAVTNVSPVYEFTSKSLDAILDLISLTGSCIGTGASQPLEHFEQYQRNLTNCLSASTSHLKDRVAVGLARLGSIEATRGEDAIISAIIDAHTDTTGANSPVARSTGVALPSGIINNRFTLGLVTINGVDYDEIDNVSLGFGVETTAKRPKLARLWPQSQGVLTVRPVLRLTGRDVSKITNALILAGAELAPHSTSKIRFKKRSTASAFVADLTAEHIEITLAGLHLPENLASSQPGSASSASTTLLAYNDGTNAPAVIDTTATYSEA